jgi:hypothetical protein
VRDNFKWMNAHSFKWDTLKFDGVFFKKNIIKL